MQTLIARNLTKQYGQTTALANLHLSIDKGEIFCLPYPIDKWSVSADKQGQWNVRGSWEFAPLSFLYIVFNESDFRETPVKNQSFISKLTYLKQF
jgi:hypothetical protein